MRLLVISLWLLVAPAAFAQAPEAPDVLNRVYACADVADDAQRLACFDAAVGRMRQAEQQGAFAAVDRAKAQEVERESFGFSIPSLSGLIPRLNGDDAPALTDMQMTVERVVALARGRHAFVMTNGQTWTQTEAQRAHNIRAGDTITVRRAAFGSFLLSPARSGLAHRVRRES